MARSPSANKAERSVGGKDTEIMLGLLTAIEQNSGITQRSLSDELGIALGLANTYLKRCARKGLVKIKQVPLNRYAYYLTPRGFSEKARLTTEFLSVSFSFFRHARQECLELLDHCAVRGWRRVALFGVGDLAEIATLCGNERVQVVAIVDPGHAGHSFARLPVVDRIDAIQPLDAIIITDLTHPQATYDALALTLPRERILTPGLLRIVTDERPEETTPGADETV